MAAQPLPQMEMDWEKDILSFYHAGFNAFQQMGILPYMLEIGANKSIKLILDLRKSFLFHFNVCFLVLHFLKAALLLGIQYWTDFEFEVFVGGSNIQVLWNLGFIWMLVLLHSMVWHMENVSNTITACIRVEQFIATGMKGNNF